MLKLLPALLLLLLTGCAETITLTRGSYYSDFEEANLQCYGATNRVRLRDGSTVTTNRLVLAQDSATWFLPDGQRQRVRLWDIQRVDIVNHLHGARDGAFVGLLVGLGGGLAVASQVDASTTLAKVGIGVGSALTSFAGSVLGSVVGRAIGKHAAINFDFGAAVPSDTARPVIRSAAGWSMPESSDTTRKP